MSNSVIPLGSTFRDPISQWYDFKRVAMSKQSKGMTEQADYVKSKLPGKTKAPEVSILPGETLQKFTGEYDFDGTS